MATTLLLIVLLLYVDVYTSLKTNNVRMIDGSSEFSVLYVQSIAFSGLNFRTGKFYAYGQ